MFGESLSGIFPFLQLSIKGSLSKKEARLNPLKTDNLNKNKSIGIGIFTNHSTNLFQYT